MFLKLFSVVLDLFLKLVPLFLAKKSGEDKVEKEVLNKTVEGGKVRNEIEEHSANDSRDDIIAWLRQRESDKQRNNDPSV